MRVRVAVGAGAGVGRGEALLVLKGPVLVVKTEHHQMQDRDMCLEVLPNPRLAQVAAVAIQNLEWKLMDIYDKKIQIIMLHHVNTTFFSLKCLASSKCLVGLLAAPNASRRMANLLLI